MTETIVVTGGAGFIGGNFVLQWMNAGRGPLVNLDKLTYAGNLQTLESVAGNPDYTFVHGDIDDPALVAAIFAEHQPRAIVHFAAESHVDRSILGPEVFVQTNIHGTFNLLEAARKYFAQLSPEDQAKFRFLHVSTDEVYGTLNLSDPPFCEKTPYAPNSPYAASKAGSDFLARSWFHTYKLPVLITNCSNNYGPYQFPEKLIPLVINNALQGKPLPIYGDGMQIRDWLFVEDHCRAITEVLAKGRPGETYNVGGCNQRTNKAVVTTICALLDELVPDSPHRPHANLITSVKDRPGHDRRYAIDASKIGREIGWKPAESFETGLRKTVEWYLNNRDWVEGVTSGSYQQWVSANYGNRETRKPAEVTR